MSSEYRGEVKPRRSMSRHHVELSAASHSRLPVNDPFPPISSKQFPALYVRNPIRNQYRQYMRAKQTYKKPRF